MKPNFTCTTSNEVENILQQMEDHIACEAESNAEAIINGVVVSVTKHWNAEQHFSYGVWAVSGVDCDYRQIQEKVLA